MLTLQYLATQLQSSVATLKEGFKQAGVQRTLTSDTRLTEEEIQQYYAWWEFRKASRPLVDEMSERDRRSYDYLFRVIEQHDLIFIDTSALLLDASVHFIKYLGEALVHHKKKLTLPFKVYEELQKHQAQTKDKGLQGRAEQANRLLGELQHSDILVMRGDQAMDKFADNTFNTQITRLRMDYKIVLITNDIGLGQDVLRLNESQSVRGKRVSAYKVSRFNFLQRILTVEENRERDVNKPKQTPRPQSTPSTEKRRVPKSEQFEVATSMTMTKNRLLPLTAEVRMGATLRDGSGAFIRLTEELGSGGEGSVYATNQSGVVAKVYKKGRLEQQKYEKLKLMVSKPLRHEGICYPEQLLFNEHHEFVGYTMPQAQGRELKNFLFIPKKVFELRNPDWTREHLAQLSVTILEKLQYLHERNIVLGDINPFNILVASPTEVYFVDVDSYQIEGFPCPVGTDSYTAPEIQGKNFGTFLRTMGNEQFAVATLLFSILFLGKLPYSQTGGDTNTKNIQEMEFPYHLKGERPENTPKGQWRYIWSNLPRYMKVPFYETFQAGEKHATEATRIPVAEWLSVMRRYHNDLRSGLLIKQDEMANVIFPNRFKVIGDSQTLEACSICSQDFMKWQLTGGICRDCSYKGEEYGCARCGKELIFTNFEKYVHKQSKRHEHCKDCTAHYRSVWTSRACTDCSGTFELTFRDKEFFEKRGFDYPKRCRSCREQRRNGHAQTHVHVHQTETVSRSTSPPQEERPKRSWCFLTTVACDYYGLPDDCEPLKTLRAYRDNWLAFQPGGESMIQQYYDIAPRIVSAIKKSPYFAEICETMMREYIKPCLQLINQNKMEACLVHYKKMIDWCGTVTAEEVI